MQSPVQHYWSLSAEEQFYLVWPVLILASSPCSPAAAHARLAMGALAAASLAYSIYDTHANPAAAYFVTPTRAWEFAAGGLLALRGRAAPLAAVGLPGRGWRRSRVAAVVLQRRTRPFPGCAALPPCWARSR